jgi:ParB family chromosome partitioning protein
MATYATNRLYQVPLSDLRTDPNQSRKHMDPVALDELTDSVRQWGIIEPIICRKDPATGLVYIVAGARRCAAARKAGLSTVPAIFIEGTQYIEIALVENLQRQDLNPIEEAEALQRLIDGTAYPKEQPVAATGKSRPPTSVPSRSSASPMRSGAGTVRTPPFPRGN